MTLKRRAELGPYEPADIAALDALAPELHAAFGVARRVLDAEASGMARVLHERGDTVFELDASGRVLRVHGNGTDGSGLLVRNRRLFAAERLAQSQLDQAITAGVTPPQKSALASIADQRGERRFLQIVPVTGLARDVFLAASAVAVIIDPAKQRAGIHMLPDALQDALGLTAREAQIAALLAEGLSLTEIAGRLRLQVGTARNHLKAIFEKTGTRRQGELIALLSQLKS